MYNLKSLTAQGTTTSKVLASKSKLDIRQLLEGLLEVCVVLEGIYALLVVCARIICPSQLFQGEPLPRMRCTHKYMISWSDKIKDSHVKTANLLAAFLTPGAAHSRGGAGKRQHAREWVHQWYAERQAGPLMYCGSSFIASSASASAFTCRPMCRRAMDRLLQSTHPIMLDLIIFCFVPA